MLTSHSSWGEWFPPGLGGLTYLTSHIFTMVVSALLWGQRSEFQTSWVITDFTGFSAHPLPARSTNPSHELLFVAPPSLLWFFLDPFWLQVKKLSWWMQRFHPCCHFCCRFKSDQIILGGGFSDQRIKSLISSFKSTNLPHWLQVSVEFHLMLHSSGFRSQDLPLPFSPLQPKPSITSAAGRPDSC